MLSFASQQPRALCRVCSALSSYRAELRPAPSRSHAAFSHCLSILLRMWPEPVMFADRVAAPPLMILCAFAPQSTPSPFFARHFAPAEAFWFHFRVSRRRMIQYFAASFRLMPLIATLFRFLLHCAFTSASPIAFRHTGRIAAADALSAEVRLCRAGR